MCASDVVKGKINTEDLAKQKAKVEELLNLPVEGRFWFVLDIQWWTKWCAFIKAATSGESLEVALDDFPGEIDNTNLLTPNGQLKQDLLLEEDLTLIPEEVWDILVKYYGCVHNEKSVFRRAAVQTPSGRWVVEIYPPQFSFIELNTHKILFNGVYSESQTISELKSVVKKNLNLGSNANVRLFVREGAVVEELTNDEVTIGEASLERKKDLFVKIDTVDSLKASHANSSELAKSLLLSPALSGNYLPHNSTNQHVPGVCGLTNLGNTCFMNSAIQCMSNVPELTNYFSGDWKKDINKHNPLGTHGRLATAYAELISHMWSGLYSCDVPRTFKREIASVATQFSGCAQHDSHELLMFLLDFLHEDLNRVINKPYVESKDADDRPDEVVAEESWMNHKARNDSIIVDCFHGQLKSTVVCPTCKYRSVTFDPYASLTLPLPEISTYYRLVYVWPWVHSGRSVGPLRFEVPVHSVFSVRDLLSALESLRPLSSGCQYYVAEVYNHSVGRPYHLDHQIRDRYGPPLFAYELPPGELIPVRLHRPNTYNASGWVGIPFYISLPQSAQSALDQNYLISSIVSRLQAIGITSVKAVDDNDGTMTVLPTQSLNNAENVSGDRYGTNPRAADSRDLDGDALMEESKQDTGLNGQGSALAQLLVNRIHLTDDFSQDLVDFSNGARVDLTTSVHSFLRVLIDCTDSVLHTDLEKLMQAITETHRHSSVSVNSPKLAVTLAQCVEKFVTIEQLSPRNLWYCRHCKEEKQATKKFDLWSLPKILVIQLKRFRCTQRLRDKIDSLVDFPIKGLDLTPWVVRSTGERFVYDLIAVINHMGGLYGGHYVAYAMNHRTQCWYRFNDASTSKIAESEIVTSSAYVLVYRRREVDALPNSPNQTNCASLPNNNTNEPISSANFSSHNSAAASSWCFNDADLDSVE